MVVAGLLLWTLYVAGTLTPVYMSFVTSVGMFVATSVGLPSFIWLAINNWEIGETNVTGITLAECVSLSGYSLMPVIPAYVLRVFSPFRIINQGAVLGAAVAGALFLRRNFWPVLRACPTVDTDRLSWVMWLWCANHVVLILLTSAMFLR